MSTTNKKSASGANQNADFISNNNFNSNQSGKKMKPGYFSDLQYYPRANPIFISIDWQCLNYIRNHHGVCLLCNKNSEFYDFNFCNNKYIWVLFSGESNIGIAMKLAYTILRNLPIEVQVIEFNDELLAGDEL